MNKLSFEKFLKENRKAIEKLVEEKIKNLFGIDINVGETITNDIINNFVNRIGQQVLMDVLVLFLKTKYQKHEKRQKNGGKIKHTKKKHQTITITIF